MHDGPVFGEYHESAEEELADVLELDLYEPLEKRELAATQSAAQKQDILPADQLLPLPAASEAQLAPAPDDPQAPAHIICYEHGFRTSQASTCR